MPCCPLDKIQQSRVSVPLVRRFHGLRVHYPQKQLSEAVWSPLTYLFPSPKYTMSTLTTISRTSRSSLLPFRSQPSPFNLTADPSLAPKSARPPQTLTSPRYSLLRRLSAASQPVLPSSPALVSSLGDLFEFICAGPLLQRMGFTTESVVEGIDKWLLCGGYLCRLFGMNELRLSAPDKARVYHYYVPVFIWCEQQIERHEMRFGDVEEAIPPLVIGISAPQGSGKTTLVFALEYLFRRTGRNAATLSIDDFYLTADEQAKLRSQNPGNALLEFRGNAGSHDLQFSVDTLTALKELTKPGMKMKLPRYDKSAYGGRGDRSDPSEWPEVEGPLTVLLFEGWMLGFKPLSSDVVKAVDPQLEIVNKNLEAYYDAWERFVNAWIIIKIKDPSCVFQWRLQAEVAMRDDGKPGMSNEEVLDFVSRYLPSYKAYLPALYSEGPKDFDEERLLVIDIDEERNPISEN